MQIQPLRLAIVGGNRGSRLDQVLQVMADQIELVAICDVNEDLLQAWESHYPGVKTYLDYWRMLEDESIEAVYIASPMAFHARQSIEALQAGKHVLSEVLAIQTLEEAWELIEAVERSGLCYMMAENYCFSRSVLTIGHLIEQGHMGKLTYMEGGYIHDCRHLIAQPDGSLTWRGQLHQTYNGMNYPTHSLGPLAHWLNADKAGGGDRLKQLTGFASPAKSLQNYFHEHHGSEHPAAQNGYWRQGDSSVVVIQTQNDVLLTLRVDWTSARPPNPTHYVVQGTEGAYLSGRHEQEADWIWLNGLSPKEADGQTAVWESLSSYQPRFDHPLWQEWGHEASQFRHGGGDFLVYVEFVSAIREQRAPKVDVYDAVTWSSVFALSTESVAAGGKSMLFPNFKSKD
ncbi:Gfo/Idh/MocA family oxidoreductase [Paenibacillus sp. SYP-B3998]|uniref:Gfo/Idh/MocA family oxidoreductase n=1 Tax=Paenibacillus sp. SYP-B3998 TaxID=2678564 RepID=A0A6G4A0C4_9BACL|nr:Gfo/Idh/MocA family oxidoreductase [Paenibacillus sp. SYP-B3998]NEW07384.1 Gfo/Idh/MocA family oxidoreductase [Paenibacillus sp. SYP-B3998]